MSNEEIKNNEEVLPNKKDVRKNKPKKRVQQVRRQKQITLILLVMMAGIGIFQLQSAKAEKKVYIDENVYTSLTFNEPIKQTLEILTIENKGNEKLFNNQNNKVEYSDIKNYREDNLQRYQAYHALHPELLEAEVIWKVNVRFDYEQYTNIVIVENGNDVASVINKNNAVYDGFVPNDLVVLEGVSKQNLYVQSEVNEAFKQMKDALKKADLEVDVLNAYEDFETLNANYQALVNEKGLEVADKEGVRPGHSEHQLGLAIDLSDKSDKNFNETDTYHWLKSNAHRFGFIFRYDMAEDKTGYPKESKHLRYVGKDIAIDMYEKNVPVLEEYLDKYAS